MRNIDAVFLSNSKFMMGFSSLMDTYLRLSKRSDEAWFPERHNPYSEFRQQVSGLVQDAKALLNDTMVILRVSYASSFNLVLIMPIVL